jgi:YidC/Oxa1 family membrane protein insertase
MDERRAILAVVLIFVLLFAYNFYVRQQSAKQVPELAEGPGVESVMDDVEGARVSDRLVTMPGEVAEAESSDEGNAAPGVSRESEGTLAAGDLTALPGAGMEESLLRVETPLWTAILTNRGGAIASWELAEYQARDGMPVQLVPPGDRGLRILVRAGTETIDTGAWHFTGDGRSQIVIDERSGPVSVRYEATRRDGVGVTRDYTFYPDSYVFDLAVTVMGLDEPMARRDLVIGWPGILPTEVKEDKKSLASTIMIDGKPRRNDIGSLRKETLKRFAGEIAWATSQSRYFIAAVAPEESIFSEVEAFGDQERQTVGFRGAVALPQGSGATKFTVFVGPQDYRLVSAAGAGLDRAVDLGWSLTRPLSVLMLRAFMWAHGIIGNYGVVIILFSILTKLLFYRLTHKSFTEMKRMQELQPKLEELKKKYENEKEALAREQMALYKREGVNPLGAGCLPMLLQAPVFIALFQVLRTTIELRGAPFALWINDLSQPDTIASIAGFPLHVLPILMGVGMLVQQRFSSKDSSQAAIGNMMPILFTALFYNFASGLVLYWLVNTVLSVAQQYYIHRGPTTAADVSPGAAAPGDIAGQPTSSVTIAPEFDAEEAEVVETSKPLDSKKKRKKRRRKKK